MSIIQQQAAEHLTHYVSDFICGTNLADLSQDVVGTVFAIGRPVSDPEDDTPPKHRRGDSSEDLRATLARARARCQRISQRCAQVTAAELPRASGEPPHDPEDT